MRSSSTIKKISFIIIVVSCLLIINNLARSTYDLWHKQDLVVKTDRDLDRAKQENQALKARLTQVKSKEFIEKEARNKLFMVKPGESKVIVPSELIAQKKAKREAEISNWQKWIDLFLGN